MTTLSGPGFQHLDLLHPHKLVDYAVLPAALLPKAHLVLAKVAGYDTACFGLPNPSHTFPFLVTASPTVMVAATQLSYCRRRRFAPSSRWMGVVAHILAFVSGGAWAPANTSVPLWTPTVGQVHFRRRICNVCALGPIFNEKPY